MTKQHRRWDKESIVSELRSLHSQGVPLTFKELESTDLGLLRAASRQFGSLQAAVEAAGLEYVRLKEPDKWTEEKILAGFRGLQAKGVTMTQTDVFEANRGLYYAAKKRYGTFEEALEAAGVEREFRTGQGWPRRWSAERVIDEIKLAQSHGLDLSYQGVVERDRALYSAACNYHGSWRAAVQAAGIEYENVMRKPRRA